MAGFDFSILLAVTMISFFMMLVVEGVLIRLLLSGRRGAKEVGDIARLNEQVTRELGEGQARGLPEPAPSVTEHTTRAFAPIYNERQSE